MTGSTPAPAPATGLQTVGALREREEQLRQVVEATYDYALFMLDAEGRVATWDARAARFEGYPAEEVLGRPVSLFYPGESQKAGLPDLDLEAARRGGRFETEGWRERWGGGRFWAHVVLATVREGGALVGFSCVMRDVTERHRALEQFRLAIEAAPTGMLMINQAGRIVLVNAQIEKLFGYGRDELIGQPIEMLVPARFRAHHPSNRDGFYRDPRPRTLGRGRDLYGLRKDGSEVPVEIGLNPLFTSEGEFVLSSVADITERKGAEREREDLMEQLKTLNAELEARVSTRTSELTAALREREVLLQEVHHRVKNNLQVISSLINMQTRKLEPGTPRDALEECQTRVQAIALIHEQLYQSKDYSRVPFSEYARSLASNVFHTTGRSQSAVSLDLRIGDLALAVDKAIPCGLLLNELITNATKHAFGDDHPGTIVVELRQLDAGRLRLIVQDDGRGLPEGFDIWKSESMGLQLVCTLAEQLDAELEVKSGGGARFQVTFPAGG